MDYEESTRRYALCGIAHERLGTKVQVAQHFVAVSPAHHADHVGVDLGTQEGHGALCADVTREKIEAWADKGE